MYHILKFYKTYKNEMILKNAFETIVKDSTLKVHYFMFSVYFLNFIIMYIFLFKLAILSQFFCHINDFTMTN
jgi:hypothetical protein